MSEIDLNPSSWQAPAAVDRMQRLGLIAAAVGGLLAVVGFFVSPDTFFRSYLIGYVYWLAVALGCLALSMLHHLSTGAWGLVSRRILEASSRTLPLFALLVIPILLGMESLFSWTDPEYLAHHEIVAHKEPYLNSGFFMLRQAIYFAAWIGLAFYLGRMSLRQDKGPDAKLTRRMQLFSAFGLGLLVLTVTFNSFDLLMSLAPEWYSTIHGVWYLGGAGLATLAFVILVANFLGKHEPMNKVFAPRHFHDWGKLMFAFTMLWAYFSFSQFLIIWSANLPEEIGWYLDRTRQGWQIWALVLVVAHFALPFALLLSRERKRQASRVVKVACWLLVARWADLIWQVVPTFEKEGLSIHWLDVAAPIGIGGLFLMYFVRELKKRPLLPLNAPHLEEAIGDE